MDRFGELCMKIWINEWHRTEVYTKDNGVVFGGLIWGGAGTHIHIRFA